MVNYGPSQACFTCKARKIRCDGEKPTCRACKKSRRTCLGYGRMPSIVLRSSGSAPDPGVCQRPSWSPRQPAFPMSELRFDPEPEVHQAFIKFFSDFVLVSKNPSVSRGYFDGLEHLLTKAGPESDLLRATRIVAMVNAANVFGENNFSHRAQLSYTDTLISFQRSLNNLKIQKSHEAVMTASMLGLYEIMVAIEAYSEAHSTHIKGLSAILFSRSVESDLLPGERLFWWLNILPRSLLEDTAAFRLLSTEHLQEAKPSTYSLDALMIRLRTTLLRANDIMSNPKASQTHLRRLNKEATLLNREFSLWSLCQQKEWKPQTIGIIERQIESTGISIEDMSFWPGKVDSYFDLYVAAVWDTYRKCRLKLLQVVVDCSARLEKKTSILQKLNGEIQELVDGLCASIPFHLAANLDGLQTDNAIDHLNTPGKPLGGLLLMYPLYIASTLSVVPPDQRAWMKGRLRWIGKYMGIRQATMLGNTDLVPHLAIADGHSLVLSGTLISPPG